MSSDLTPFVFEATQIRTITDENGEPWFVLRDILSALGSTTTTTSAVESIETGLGKGYANDHNLPGRGGAQRTTIVTEAAATYLLSRSNTEQGRKLNRFIHAEVLPAIRKTGKYAVPAPLRTPSLTAQLASDIDIMVTLALKYGVPEAHALTQAARAVDLAAGTDVWMPLLSQASCMTTPIGADRLLEPTDLGQMFDMSAREMNRLLERAGWQISRFGSWVPTAKGAPFAHNNVWTSRFRTGYNLKWSLLAVEDLVQSQQQLSDGE